MRLRQLRRRALIRILAQTNGMAAARRALPTYFGLFIVAVILFAGNGVRSRDVVDLALASPPTRVLLLAAWLLLTLPPARAILCEPSSFLTRTWPIPRAEILAVLGGLLVLVEGPWMLMWLKGGGPLVGSAATVLALGGHALLLGRPRTARELGAGVLWLVGVAALAAPGLALLAGLPALVLGLRRAFIAAPERIGVTRTRLLVRPGRSAALAIAQAHVAIMLRGQRPALLRAAWFAAGGALAAGLAAANNGVVDPQRVAAIWRAAAVLTVGWGVLGLAGGVERGARAAAWLFVVCGVSTGTRRRGAGLALVCVGLVLGAGSGAALGAFSSGPGAYAFAGQGAAAGAAGAAVASACGGWALRGDGRDGARLLPCVLVGAGALAAVAFILPVFALWAAAAAALLATGPRLAERRRAGPAILAGEG